MNGYMKSKNLSISPKEFTDFTNKLTKSGVNTICDSALCINRPECYKRKTVAFLLMGDICNRNCRYCAVRRGIPKELDPEEPKKVAKTVKELNLKYIVLTSVTRDDLPDQGAYHFKEVVREIRRINRNVKIELLIPDLWGKEELLDIIVKSKPDVINHNIEGARNCFPFIRPRGNYDISLKILRTVKKLNSSMVTKSGLMVGVGESFEDIKKTILDLRQNLVDIVTVGQYLSPGKIFFRMAKIYKENEFNEIREFAQSLNCFKNVFVGVNVRSSYHADEQLNF